MNVPEIIILVLCIVLGITFIPYIVVKGVMWAYFEAKIWYRKKTELFNDQKEINHGQDRQKKSN